MFTTAGSVLESHLASSSTVKSQSAIIAEWNLNYMTNIDEVGNYFYNPQVGGLTNTFAKETFTTVSPKYYGGTESNVGISAGFNSDGTVASAFTKANQREKLLYSLEDCLQRFRPRSGINKARFFNTGFIHHTYNKMANRPRYYLASKNDIFKYWSSYKSKFDSINNKNVEYGIAKTAVSGNTAPYYITDAAPFVTYKNNIPANRIIVKMQTNVGTENIGNIKTSTGQTVADPFYGSTNKTTPITWKVQTLQGTTWTDAVSFTSDIVPTDGYVELSYGISNIPVQFANNFVYADTIADASLLPATSITGYAYLVKTGTSIGQYYVWNGASYTNFTPTYSWYQSAEGLAPSTTTVTDLVNPASYVSGTTQYREFQYIKGIRIVVDTMNKYNATFDLIEMSPRLVADLSEIAISYSTTRTASDLGSSGLPVGQLLASTGSLTLFDADQAFNSSNTNSIINGFSGINLQIKFYEIISQVSGSDYYVPIKTYYAEGFPEFNNENRQVTINLRDLFFYFESMKAPQLFIRNASLSYVISTLMDSIGFTNYTFRRNSNETDEPIIPNFVVSPDTTVAQVLNDLAASTQYAMFFDEYNNFVILSRNRMMPSTAEYQANTGTTNTSDLALVGNVDASDTGVIKNNPTGATIANIINLSSTTKDVFNDGKIVYTQKHIQRDRGSIAEATKLPNKQQWVYRPALLWEVSSTENVRPVNSEFANQSSYALGAIPLNTTLSNKLPYVTYANSVYTVNNNIIDLGEAVYWLPRYKGYFYANGEIIKYDAVEYSVDGFGNVWITSAQEYDYYFQELPFRGTIYPTGRVRIFTELYYTSNGSVDNSISYVDTDGTTQTGAVAKHGRGQFGTKIATHNAGIDSYWTNTNNLYGCYMQSKYLFNTNTTSQFAGSITTTNSAMVLDTLLTNTDVTPNTTITLDFTKSGKYINGYNSDSIAQNSSVNGIIKDFLSGDYDSETNTPVSELDSTVPGTMQASALIFNGVQFSSTNPIDFVSYVHKPLSDSFNYFGTRMRVLGSLTNNDKKTNSITQVPYGSSNIFAVDQDGSDQPKNIAGSSGGVGIMVNPVTNTGYFLEIVALTNESTQTVTGAKDIANVYFYKNLANKNGVDNDQTIPVQLWSGLTNILVDDGLFTGQSKMLGDKDTSVYDLAIEYEKIPNGLRFYISINNNVLAVVEDTEPLPILNTMALFIRGSSKCMFENVYAIALDDQYGKSSGTSLISNAEPFALDNPDAKYESYGINRVVRNTFLTQVNPLSPPKYKFYYDEFGTIMRECAYFNIRYDKAYPALLAKISPTYNKFKGYAVSGFTPNAFGAEFMVFNTTDTVLNLDETSGNYLRIQGITFTQESSHDLTVDEYFSKKSDFSNPALSGKGVSPSTAKQTYLDIINSRMVYGKKDFSIQAPYIQNADTANKLMDWMVAKVMKPRRSVGLNIFPTPTIQLGDIVQVAYTDKNAIEQIPASSRFVVYSIEYNKDGSGPSMTVHLSEVI